MAQRSRRCWCCSEIVDSAVRTTVDVPALMTMTVTAINSQPSGGQPFIRDILPVVDL